MIEILTEYIVPVTMFICLCVGYIVKHVIPGDAINRWIPPIVGVLGILINVWVSEAFTPVVVLGGLASGLASTGLYEAFAQFIKKGGGNDGD